MHVSAHPSTMAAAVALLIFVLALWIQPSIQWSGHYCPFIVVHYETREGYCTERCWWWRCCAYGSVTVPVYSRRFKCCYGWTDYHGNQNCNRPICSPQCANGGTCTSPGRCTCRPGYTGATCTGRTGRPVTREKTPPRTASMTNTFPLTK